ncbi:LytR family transcriptional regulator [Halobacillus fulvus]|nr:LytR family transcriptional regulator [Halobacillus fulvus]
MKSRTLKIVLWSVALVLLIGVGAAAGYAAYLMDQVRETADQSVQKLERGDKSDMREQVVNPGDDHISVLFIGVDGSEVREGSTRSDALVLASFNDDDKSVKMVSIPRDSYTYIPEIGYEDKITHAHAFGGVDATVETVEQMFDVPVDYYVRLNFDSFVEVVDAMGGVQYDVPYDLMEQNSKGQLQAIELEEGYQRLNGEEALALARTRKYDNDLARGQRQMELIEEIARQSLNTRSIRNIDTILSTISDNLKTNLTFNEMIAFKDYFLQENGLTYEKMQLNGSGTYINGGYYYAVEDSSLSNIQDELRTHLGLMEPSDERDSQFATDDDGNI